MALRGALSVCLLSKRSYVQGSAFVTDGAEAELASAMRDTLYMGAMGEHVAVTVDVVAMRLCGTVIGHVVDGRR